ncbi:MAG: GAF domain-containing protein [Anaerolineae bacterium]|nr:GAF domain-containing protein [Anaerolineae bacterium]
MLNANDTPQTPRAHLEHLQNQLNDLEGMLRAQHDILRQRGMTLPTGVLEQIYYVRADIGKLANRLEDGSTELEQLRALADTGELITSSLDPDEVLKEVMDTAIALTGAERGYIMLRSSQTGEMQFRVARDANRQDLAENRFTVSATIVNDVAQSGQPVVAQDAMLDPNYSLQDSIVMFAPRSILCVPLVYKGQITGVVYADNQKIPNLFRDKELSLLVAFANQAAIAIENARLFERVRRTLEEITEIKDLMENVFASIASGVITTDIEHTIITYNHAAEQILGIPRNEAVGKSLHIAFPDFEEAFGDLINNVKRDNRQQILEIETLLPERGSVTLAVNMTPLKNAESVTYGLALVVDDLTEIKKRDATLNVVRTYLPPSLVRNIQSIDSLGLSGDEREISVVFADVRGFTSFSENLPPEELMAIITRYLTISSDAIQLFDGIIDKYMGDAVVGLFNTQLNPQEDHAVRAVRSAMAMAYDVQAFHEVLREDQRLSYGIGIDTGVAVLGNVGSPSRKEFTAIGLPFNFAKLLQENALAGETIISQQTYERVKNVFTVEALEPRKPKGYNFQVMYRVTGLQRHRNS